MAIGDIYKVRFACMLGSQLGLNIRHYRTVAEPLGPVPVSAIADAFDFEFAPLYKPLLVDNAEYLGVGVQLIVPAPPQLESFVVIRRGFGLAAGDPLPTQVSGLISLRTAFAGRRFRGRSYIPFPPEIYNDETGTPTAPYNTALAALALEQTQELTVTFVLQSTTLRPVIFHRTTSTSTDVTAAIPRDGWATQRRRGIFGRANTGESFGPVTVGP
jgi:hypothetical protein